MGKANRIRNQRASTVLNPSVKPAKKNNQGMPSWAVNLIAIAITAFVVITIALSLLSANGVFGRLTTAMSSDNFRVNENVMKYFYSEAASSADKTATVDQIIAAAKSDVKTMLALCEEAHKRGLATVCITNLTHAARSRSRHPEGRKLCEVCDVVIDNKGCYGDAAITVGDATTGATSTVIGSMILQAAVCRGIEIAQERKTSPEVFQSANTVGGDEANEKYIAKYKGTIRSL